MIKLNDILNLASEEIERTKFRFMVPSGDFHPNEDAKDKDKQDKINLTDLVYNRVNSVDFREGMIAIGFLELDDDKWLMTGMVDVIFCNGKAEPASAIYRDKKFNYRVVVKYHKKSQNGIFWAKKIIDKLEVLEIWDPNKSLNDNVFPGYRNVKIDFLDLKNKLRDSSEWCDKLKCRKGVYAVTDKETGKLYVGSAYGKDGFLGRFRTYMESGYDKNENENGMYPNVKFQEIVKAKGLSYIQKNFQYSILETFSDEATDKEIIDRETWWKKVLLSKEFGYNKN